MARLRHYHEENTPYFVTTVVKDRRPIFADPTVASMLRTTLEGCRQRYGFLVLAYVIMPDHVHAIIVPAARDNISAVMRYIKGTFARMYNEGRNKAGSVWQARFYDVAMRTERQLLDHIQYVEQNPVQAKLVANADEYPFSSAGPGWRSDLVEYLGG